MTPRHDRDDEAPPWFGDTDADEVAAPPWRDDTRRSALLRHALIAGLAAPWLVVAVVFARPAADSLPDGAHPTAAVSDAPSGAGAASHDGTGASGDQSAAAAPPAGNVAAVSSGARVAPGEGDAAAVAVLTARAWLAGTGPPLADGLPPLPGDGYLEHIAVEAVDFPAPDAAVVTVVAVVLDRDGDRYTQARAVRLAVPVRLDAAGARPAGVPWWLPGPALAVDELAWQQVDDPDLALRAGEALAAAGYRDVAVERVERSESWPLRVVATAAAPGDAGPRRHVVWLRDHLRQLIVAGVRPEEVLP